MTRNHGAVEAVALAKKHIGAAAIAMSVGNLVVVMALQKVRGGHQQAASRQVQSAPNFSGARSAQLAAMFLEMLHATSTR